MVGMTDQHSIQIVRADDPERFMATDELVWSGEPSSLPAAVALEPLPEDQRFAAIVEGADPGSYPGIYGAYPLLLSVPGGPTPPRLVEIAGLTWVGVHPDHRRRGVLSAMMRDHLDRARVEGYAVSALHASEQAIYGRYGYGIALTETEVALGRGTTLTAPHLDEAAAAVRTRTVTITEPGLAERMRACDLTVARTEPGTLILTEGFYRRVAQLTPAQLRDQEPPRVLFAQRDGVDVGQAVFRRKHKWERGQPNGSLTVRYLAGDPAVRLALLRRLLDFDLVGEVTIEVVGVDDPLWSWLSGPRSVTNSFVCDNVWIRLIDLPAALAMRGYEGSCDLVVEVTDELLPDNAGRWRLVVRGGEATATRTTDPAEVGLHVTDLGAAWLGAINLVARHRAGVLAEHRPDAVVELDRALRTALAPAPCAIF